MLVFWELSEAAAHTLRLGLHPNSNIQKNRAVPAFTVTSTLFLGADIHRGSSIS